MPDTPDRALTDAELLAVFQDSRADLSLLSRDERQRLVVLTEPTASQPEAAPSGAIDRLLSTAKDTAIGFGKGAAGTAVGLGQLVHQIPGVTRAVDALYGQPGLSDRAFEEADTALEARNAPQLMGKGLEFVAEMAVPSVLAARKLPTMAKAGAKFEQVMGAAKGMPVDVAKSGDVALRVHDLAERGGSMPMVVRKLLKRATDPQQGPLRYEEARDFYHNISRLSADEASRLTPVVRREITKLRAALNEAIQATAQQAGEGATYRSAMTEYRRAARGREFYEGGKKVMKKAAITSAIGGAAYQAAKAMGLVE